jgi:hypothetical protein
MRSLDPERLPARSADTRPAPRRTQFGVRGLLLTMLIVSVLFLAVGYLLHWYRSGSRGFLLAFFGVVLAGPMLLLVAVSGVSRLVRWWRDEA